jgi:S-ribosylhomocysteine lyase
MTMENIASFNIDHLRLKRGIYVSRIDRFDAAVITTFDIRMKEPNNEPVIDIPALHTLEHLGASFLRNHTQWKEKTSYFGPMGCRTGFYALFSGSLTSTDIIPLIKELFHFCADFRGKVPGCSAAECGNWRDHNLDMAQYEAKKFIGEVLNKLQAENLNYPQ